ncbi:hypothetical protein BHE90_004958 [Fusarium euwallaceae]|uniref:Zn(2)-C6 fungal-type domain-containing protein n=2 Tax=Fusarium solani species complex TaxID=232080 RepID=A0A430LXV5_9HYPO|nr:hypothetical protein CEP51_015562 [Fusarium floridanum]RTE80524.1 hypothetical protein BHE90_004958 [Fusarium euwallaceae]
MGSARKLKACYACTSGKRRCDKAQPTCGRCEDRDIDCHYPPTKRRRGHTFESDCSNAPCQASTNDGTLDSTTITFSNETDDLIDFDQWTRSLINWNALTDDPLPLSHGLPLPSVLQEHQVPPVPNAQGPSISPAETQDLAACRPVTSTTTLSSSAKSTKFFLAPESWTIRHLSLSSPTFSSSVFMNYIRGIQTWFTDWVLHCHSPFIHRQLYADTGFPASIQGAFAAISIHNTKTPANEAAIDEILEAQVASLLKSYPDAYPSSSQDIGISRALDTREHLARTQCLFVHLVLGLFSPSIRARANAEKRVQTLLQWTRQLWDAAARDPDICQSPEGDFSVPTRAAAADELFDGDPLPRLWRSWVLSESIRRTWLLATSTIGVYLTMRQSWAECQGGIQFSTRATLWDAESASSWAKRCQNDDPLFICSLDGESLLRTSKAVEVDEMARNLFTVMWGAERVEAWISRTASDKDGVRVSY